MASDDNDVPSDIEEAAQSALSAVIPRKSKNKYDLAHVKFNSWCQRKKVLHVNEKVLLALRKGLIASRNKYNKLYKLCYQYLSLIFFH